MQGRKIGRARRWFCGALVLMGALLILAALFDAQRLRAESSEQKLRQSRVTSPRQKSELGEADEGDVLLRDYFEALKRGAPRGIPFMARTRAIKAAASMPSLSGPGVWSFIGPSVITNGQGMASNSATCSQSRINVSGRVTALAFGMDPSTIYLGTASGGLWISTDGASTWSPLLDRQPSMAVGALAVVPGTPDTIYVGTGEGNNGCDNEFGQGILKSTDGGVSWAQKAAATFDRLTFTKLAIGPDPNVLFAGTSVGFVASQSFTCLPVTTGTPGVYKSTDAGETWVPRSGANGLLAGSAYDVAVDPTPSFTGLLRARSP